MPMLMLMGTSWPLMTTWASSSFWMSRSPSFAAPEADVPGMTMQNSSPP